MHDRKNTLLRCRADGNQVAHRPKLVAAGAGIRRDAKSESPVKQIAGMKVVAVSTVPSDQMAFVGADPDTGEPKVLARITRIGKDLC